MSPFPEVKHSLSRLRERGLRLAALSNANTELLEEQMKRSKLGKFFDEVISVDAVARRFKPSRDAYEGALDRLGGNPHEALMVAAHPWDLMGAAAAGFRTALIVRPGVAPYPGVQEPNYVAQNLEDFTDQLLGITHQSRNNTASWLLAGAGVGLALMKWGREPLFTACSKASPVEHH
jgi:2-haloacid dehalogenase